MHDGVVERTIKNHAENGGIRFIVPSLPPVQSVEFYLFTEKTDATFLFWIV